MLRPDMSETSFLVGASLYGTGHTAFCLEIELLDCRRCKTIGSKVLASLDGVGHIIVAAPRRA